MNSHAIKLHQMRPSELDLNKTPPLPPSFQEERDYRTRQLTKHHVNLFWRQRMLEIRNARDVKSQLVLPLARMRRMMKSDRDVKMVSADSPVLFGKACEFFILELTLRAWLFTEADSRTTIQPGDVAKAIAHDPMLHFLRDVVLKDKETSINPKEVETETEARGAKKRGPSWNLNE